MTTSARTASGRAVVIGATGGIGAALVAALLASGRYGEVHALARRPEAIDDAGAIAGPINLADQASIAAAAGRIGGAIDLVLIATGMLHAPGRMPERALRELDAAALAESFAINTIGPALAIRHFAPLLPREGPCTVAALSARVGSISDNRAGGWYGYRASKAALNMIVRCAAIEIARTRPQALCVGLHPGTVDTALSQPFQARVPTERLFTPARSAAALLAVIDGLTPADSGGCFAWDGTRIEA